MYVWVAALVLVAADLVVCRPISDDSAPGVFFRFQVSDFDRFLGFFSLYHFIFPSYLFWVVWSLCCFGDTERQLTPALNVLFWNQVVEANQFISCALAPVNPRFRGGRVLFILRCVHLASLLISASVPSRHRRG